VDIRIGITNSPREISFESSQSAAEVQQVIQTALESGAKLFTLVDNRGTAYLVPTESFGYAEIGSEEARRVGFVS